jgi:23S rRNA (uracil-5-)-methyltransferase RumA
MSKRERQHAFLNFLAGEPKMPAPCPHVAQGCGGCLLQEFAYDAQLAAKARSLSLLYGRDIVVNRCVDPLGYRNRMDFVFSFGKLGFRERGKFAWVVDVEDCHLLPEHARAAYRAARALLVESGIEPYNYVRHRGVLRYLVLRTSQTTKELLVIITTVTPPDDATGQRLERFAEELHAVTGATSTHWTLHDALGDASVGTLHKHWGAAGITDEIAGRRFAVRPKTFFQANTALAGDLFERGAQYAHGSVLDLCCGVGVFGIIAAGNPAVEMVLGVDVVEESVAAAPENAAESGVADRCTFVHQDMLVFLKAQQGSFDTVLCDPARPGLGPEVCMELLRLRPSTIVYVSCNPTSHREDLERLAPSYRVELLEGYDLFPQTPHIEMLSVLRRMD